MLIVLDRKTTSSSLTFEAYLRAEGQMRDGNIIYQDVELLCSLRETISYLQMQHPTLCTEMQRCAAQMFLAWDSII